MRLRDGRVVEPRTRVPAARSRPGDGVAFLLGLAAAGSVIGWACVLVGPAGRIALLGAAVVAGGSAALHLRRRR